MPPKKQQTLRQFLKLTSVNKDDAEISDESSQQKVTKKITKNKKQSDPKQKTKKDKKNDEKKHKDGWIPKEEWLKQYKQKQKDVWETNSKFINYKKDQTIKEVEIKDKKNLKIISWNINGIRAAFKKIDFNQFFEQYNPDIFCVNELKIDEEMFNKEIKDFGFPGYVGQYLNFCKPPKKGYSGVGIFTKIKPLNIIYDFGLENQVEGRSITLEFQNVCYVCAYFPHAGFKLERLDFRAQFNKNFHNHIQQLQKLNKSIIYGGDMNVCPSHLDIIKEHGQEFAMCTKQERSDFQKLVSDLKMVDVFRFLHPDIKKYTLHDKKRIDMFLVDDKTVKNNQDLQNLDEKQSFQCDILSDLKGSDHKAVILEIQI